MRVLIRGPLVCLLAFSLVGIGDAKSKKRSKSKIPSLGLEQYVKTVLKQGPDALKAYNNFENSTLSYKVSYRNSRLPSLTAQTGVGKRKSDINSDISYTKDADGSVSLSQPFYPTGASLSASVSESYSRTDSSGSFTQSFTRPSYSVSLSQPLYLFVGNSAWRSWKRSKVNYMITEDNFKRELQSIENTAQAKYYDVLLKTEQFKIEQVKFESSRRSHKITRALVRAGRRAGIELSRSDVQLQQDKRRLKNANTALEESINEAYEFASLPNDLKFNFSSKLTYKPIELNLDSLIRYALQHRPDYIAAKSQLELSELDLKEEMESDNPVITADASLSKTDSGTTSSNSKSEVFQGGVNVTWPFFDSRITHLNIVSKKNSLENSRIDLAALERNIRKSVTNAYIKVKNNEEQLADLERSRNQARKSVKVVRTRYKNGRDSLIDVFDVEKSLREVELEFVDVKINANLSRNNLALEVGGRLSEASK